MGKLLKTLTPCFVVVLLCGSLLRAQNTAEKIDALVQKYCDYGQFNGSLLVAENGTVLLKKGYGYANFEWDIPCTPDTKFRLGSMTKQFTGMLVMQQVEKGSIRLDDSLMKYLPDYPNSEGRKVTVRHLLNHTSGIPNYTEMISFRTDRNPYPLEKLIAVFADKPLEFEPGTRWKYSNSGYVLLGAILEKATGHSYEQLLQEGIFDPLGMKNTGYDHAKPILKKRAAGYDKLGMLLNTDFLDMSVPFSAGALYSTVEDLYLWDRALYTDRLISEKSKEEYFRPSLNDYAFGWLITHLHVGKTPDSVRTISHGGGINGFNTLIVRIPAQQHLIILLNNTGEAPLTEMATGIAGILYGKPYAAARQSLAAELGRIIDKNGCEKARSDFTLLRQKVEEYFVSESEMNNLGYALMQRGDVKAALEVFRLNSEEFPNSWNVYDSLGEAYMNDGQTALAIQNYEKSIELNPNNAGGKNALKVLKEKF
jgi:CubicO group peptidase (beta-lactamase class C family)